MGITDNWTMPLSVSCPIPSGRTIDPVDNITDKEVVPEKAMRFNTGKHKMSYVPFFLLRGFCNVMQAGAKKYSKGNWLLGGDINQYIDSTMRHLESIQLFSDSGENDARLLYDTETWMDHTSHILFNILALRLALIRHPKVNLKLDPEFNPNPAKSKKEVDVKAFLSKMEELYPGSKSEWMDMLLKNDYGYEE